MKLSVLLHMNRKQHGCFYSSQWHLVPIFSLEFGPDSGLVWQNRVLCRKMSPLPAFFCRTSLPFSPNPRTHICGLCVGSGRENAPKIFQRKSQPVLYNKSSIVKESTCCTRMKIYCNVYGLLCNQSSSGFTLIIIIYRFHYKNSFFLHSCQFWENILWCCRCPWSKSALWQPSRWRLKVKMPPWRRALKSSSCRRISSTSSRLINPSTNLGRLVSVSPCPLWKWKCWSF